MFFFAVSYAMSSALFCCVYPGYRSQKCVKWGSSVSLLVVRRTTGCVRVVLLNKCVANFVVVVRTKRCTLLLHEVQRCTLAVCFVDKSNPSCLSCTLLVACERDGLDKVRLL
jgi:hypothetical protein